MMRFVTSSVSKCKARIGKISELERKPDLSFETPLLLLYTRRGSVPHLTKDVLNSVTPDKHMLSISLPNTISMTDSIKEFDSLSKFISMEEYPTFMTIQDPTEETDSSNQKHNTVSVWSKQGRVRLTASSYMDLVQTYKPDIFLALCDGDTDVNSSNKRISYSVDKSVDLLEKCLKIKEDSPILKNTPMLGAIEGGYSLSAREKNIKHMVNLPLSGYLIDGLHKNGSQVADIDFKTFELVITHSLNLLPKDKLRVTLGCYNPSTLLNLVALGIDVFDSSYAYVMTEQAKALVFLCDDCPDNPKSILNVMDKRYVDDFSPLCKGCQCLTCKEHSKAYINHLFLTKELLGSVLLMIHNLHTYIEFFKRIRNHIKEGTLSQFQQSIVSKFSL